MSIRGVFTWLFDVGDQVGQVGADGPKPADSPDRPRNDRRPGQVVERQLYGEAEAIRVLYQTGLVEESPSPPRPKRGRGVWVARCLDSLSPSLGHPVGAKG